MKIIQLIYSLGNGGAEKFTVELSNELANDHQVSLYTFIKNEDWMIPPTNLNSNVNNDFLNLHKKFSIYNFIILYRLLKKQKPNVVHVQSSIALLNAYLLPLFFPKTKFILTIHSTLTENYTKAFNILSKLFFIKKKWKHVCISQSILADFSIKFKGFKFYSIDNGIAPITTSDYLTKVEKELNDLSTNINNTRIIAIGNYSDFKRFDLLVDVVNELNNEGKNLDLFIIGEDNSKDKINYNKVLAKKTEHIHLLGLRNNIADYMSFVDVLVISSSHEGMPLVVIEGMCMGLPIVSTPAGGIVDMVENNVNGFLSEDFSKESLKIALINFLKSSEEQRRHISENNLNKYKLQYSIKYCAKNYVRIYES